MAASDQTTIESLTELTALAAADRLVVEDDSANETKYIQASNIGGRYMSVVAKTTHYTAAEGDDLIVVNAAAATTITLPPGPTTGTKFTVKRINATYTVTLDGDGSDTIDDSTTLELTSQYDSATVVWDGSEWWVI